MQKIFIQSLYQEAQTTVLSTVIYWVRNIGIRKETSNSPCL